LTELGGTVYWTAEAANKTYDGTRVDFYRVFLASDSIGTLRSKIGLDILYGVNQEPIPPETSLSAKFWQEGNSTRYPEGNGSYLIPSFTKVQRFWSGDIVVYTKSTLVEQTTPGTLAILDRVSLASNTSFPDNDLDETELGGVLSWIEPDDAVEVIHYNIYLANDDRGLSRQFFANVSVGIDSLTIPINTPVDDVVPAFSHFAIYTASTLVEQTTPLGFKFFDMVANVANITFVGTDLDLDELGGTLSWTAPFDTSQRERASSMPVTRRPANQVIIASFPPPEPRS
jgi:hypothetical protein